MLAELKALKQLRLDHDWTWEQLAEEINRGTDPALAIPPRTLHYLLTYAKARPRDRTLHKIQGYLAREEDRRRRTARRRRARRKATASPSVAASL